MSENQTDKPESSLEPKTEPAKVIGRLLINIDPELSAALDEFTAFLIAQVNEIEQKRIFTEAQINQFKGLLADAALQKSEMDEVAEYVQKMYDRFSQHAENLSILYAKLEKVGTSQRSQYSPQPQLMAYAPKDREIFVYCPPMHGLSELISRSKWHPDAGFCVDELRTPVLWWDIPENVTLAYEAAVALDEMSSTETVLTEVYKTPHKTNRELERRRNEPKSTTDEEAPTLSGEARPKQSTAASPNIEFELYKVPPRNWELSCQGIVYGAFMERSRAVQIINYCSVILSDLMLKGIMPERRIRHQLETTNGLISDYFFGDDQVMMINPEDEDKTEGSEGS